MFPLVNVPNGCHLHPDCFTCPFPDCQYGKRASGPNTHAEVLQLKSAGRSTARIARELGISQRTVGRHLEKERR